MMNGEGGSKEDIIKGTDQKKDEKQKDYIVRHFGQKQPYLKEKEK